LTKYQVVRLSHDLLKNKVDLWNWFRTFVGLEQDVHIEEEDKLSNNNISETNTESNGSYKLIPEKYRNNQCSGRTELDSSVLNDSWTTSQKQSRPSLISYLKKDNDGQSEDNITEWVYNTESNLVTTKKLEQILKTIEAIPLEERENYSIPSGTFSPYELKSIKVLYDNKANEMEFALVTKPYITIPIVLKRLKQKYNEWSSMREGENIKKKMKIKIKVKCN